MAGRAARSNTGLSGAQGGRSARPAENLRSSARAGSDRLAPVRCATALALRPPLQRDAEICGGEVSLVPLYASAIDIYGTSATSFGLDICSPNDRRPLFGIVAD